MADNQLNEKLIEKKLMSFNNSQESVQAVSLWIMQNRSQHKKIVNTWMKVLRKSQSKHKLTLFYLCNDVVQHAKKKKALYYLENFKDNLREAVHIIRELDAIKPNINRIFKIWEERRTYDGKFITELRKIMDSTSDISGGSSANATPGSTNASPAVAYKPSKKSAPKPPPVSSKSGKESKSRERRKREKEERREERKHQQPPEAMDKNSVKSAGEFKTNKFIEEMTDLRQLEGDANLKAKQLAAMRIDATNVEAVKQLKDRSHGNEFCKQFEESCLKIEDYVTLLEREIAQRGMVLSMCEEAEAFYDEQYSEAKIVATAYKNFGARVTNMKRRVDDMQKIIPGTPSPVPSPSADAPSPGNTPPLQDMDDNDHVDMELEEDAAPAKIQDATQAVPPLGGAYTAMVKSIDQPISSVTDITMRSEEKHKEDPPVKQEDDDDSPDTHPIPPHSRKVETQESQGFDLQSQPSFLPESGSFNSITDTFQGSNILDSRIASMLPNLAKGSSSLGSHAPVVISLDDSPEPSRTPPEPPREPIPDYVPPKVIRVPEEEPDDRSSTPVQDEPEDNSPSMSPTPPPKSPPPVSKTPVTKTKTNPIDFLSQLLTKTSNSSSSSNFLQSLSLLTNTVKNQYQKKQEGDGEAPTEPPASVSQAPIIEHSTGYAVGARQEPMTVPVVEHSSGYASVPPPEPMTKTSPWSAWKPAGMPPQQPPLPQAEPPSPPVLPGVKSPDVQPRPSVPQHPPLPPEPFPGQPPSPQNFSVPPPASSQPPPYGPPGQPGLQPRPILRPFTPTATSPPAFPVTPANSQSFPNQSSGSSTSPGAAVPPPRVQTGFNPLFPFGPVPQRDAPPPPQPPQPPPPQLEPPAPPQPHFPGQNSWKQQNNMPPGNPPGMVGGYHGPPPPSESAPAPWQQREPPSGSQQQAAGGYGNTIHTLASRRPSWERPREPDFNQRDTNWNRNVPVSNVGPGGYAHPWDRPQNYDDEEEDNDVVKALPPKPLPPTPKSILRNRSSSLREVTLVDESERNPDNPGHMEAMPPAPPHPPPPPPPAPEAWPTGILKKPPMDGGGARGHSGPGDVQSEFIAKLKQKSGGNVNMPLPQHGGRQLTSVPIEVQDDDDGVAEIDLDMDIRGDQPDAAHTAHRSEAQPISSIGVISSNGRSASVKSDDMELDSDGPDSIVEAKSEASWDNTDEQLWQEERQEFVPPPDFSQPQEPSHEAHREPSHEIHREPPDHFHHPRPPPQEQPRYQYDSFQPRGGGHHPNRPPMFRENFRGAAPPPRRQFHQARAPYYRY